MFNKNNKKQIVKYLEIKDIVSFNLKLMTMRGTYGYMVSKRNDAFFLDRYQMYYLNREKEMRIEASKQIEITSFSQELNNLNVGSWNGFDGKRPKNVLDGRMFNLEINFDNDKTLVASGDENYPPHFRELEDYLYYLLNE